MKYKNLHFSWNEECGQNELTTYKEKQGYLCDRNCYFKIIGQSHYIKIEDEFSEISSCKPPLYYDSIHTFDISNSTKPTVINQSIGNYTVKTFINFQPIHLFDSNEDYDLIYEFDKQAFTAINYWSDSYETFHTYPEFNKVVYSFTELERK